MPTGMTSCLVNRTRSKCKDLPFKNRFFEMAGLSLSVVGIRFLIGFLMPAVLEVEI
jgi:hypothetical protein